VQQEETPEGEPRFGMLETLREYALERLEASGEADAVRGRHLAHFLALAEAADRKLRGPEQAPWFRRLNVEHPNLRAALGWALMHWEEELALRLAVALGRFWQADAHLEDGERWLGALLERAGDDPRVVGAVAAHLAGVVILRGDFPR